VSSFGPCARAFDQHPLHAADHRCEIVAECALMRLQPLQARVLDRVGRVVSQVAAGVPGRRE
jgi:hypothetical protein